MPDPAPTQLIPQTDGELELAQIKDFLADKCHFHVSDLAGRTALEGVKQMRGDLMATVKLANRASARANKAERERDALCVAIGKVRGLLDSAVPEAE